MHSEFYLSKLSFKSIFKILLIPSFFFAILLCVVDYQNDTFLQKAGEISQELEANDPLYKHLSKNHLSKHTTKFIIMGTFGLNFFCSLWAWLCLRIYNLFFRIKIKAVITPVAHDQKVAPADESPQAPDKTELG